MESITKEAIISEVKQVRGGGEGRERSKWEGAAVHFVLGKVGRAPGRGQFSRRLKLQEPSSIPFQGSSGAPCSVFSWLHIIVYS